MAIITISRGSLGHGREVAQKTAQMLDYEHVSREILLEASKFFHVPEMKLLQSIHDAPNILERITHGKEKYLAFIRAALLEHIKNDNVVYFGHAGHLLIPDSRHILKVRVIADMEARIELIRKKENLTREQAEALIEKEDKNRSLWTHYLYKVDVFDPQLYDVVLKIGKMTVEDACEAICTLARSATYQATSESLAEIKDMALSSHVQAALAELCHADVTAKNGVVHIKVFTTKIRKHSFMNQQTQDFLKDKVKDELAVQILSIVREIDGVKDIVCDIDPQGFT